MKKKIRILLVEYCTDLSAGGAQRVFLNILKNLDVEKYKIYAGFPQNVGGDLDLEVPDYVDVFQYDSKSPDPSISKWLSYFLFVIFTPITVLRWLYIIRKERIDVVYVHSIISGFHFGLVKYFLGYRLIYHEHNMASQRPETAIWRWLFNFVIRQSDAVIAISKDVAESLHILGAPEAKIIVIHNGIDLSCVSDLERLKREGRRRMEIAGSDRRLLIGMIGHFRQWKGQAIFARSIMKLLAANVDAHYVLVGAIHDQKYYQEVLAVINENSLGDRFSILGYQKNIPEIMSCLDVVVVPSVPEPFGLVLLEAMMLCKPIVAFNVGGPAEIISHKETGLLVDNIESGFLGDAILTLALDRDLREKMGVNGRVKLEMNYTNALQCQRIDGLVNSLLASNVGK